jgi:predicted Zn-dependent protease
VGTGEALNGWESAYIERVLDAFGEWSELGIPMRFTFVVDSADADVHVNWIDHFREPISGKTLWARDKRWWIVSGSITLALRHNAGEPLDDRSIKAIALHEIGHLLGLDHTADSSNIMTSRVRVRELSDADRATMRLLYTLPPGSIKE